MGNLKLVHANLKLVSLLTCLACHISDRKKFSPSAFDLKDHNILIAKLKSLGINSREIVFFTSYLKNCTQVVDIEGHRSTPKTITNGFPQGSVLGPLPLLEI